MRRSKFLTQAIALILFFVPTLACGPSLLSGPVTPTPTKTPRPVKTLPPPNTPTPVVIQVPTNTPLPTPTDTPTPTPTPTETPTPLPTATFTPEVPPTNTPLPPPPPTNTPLPAPPPPTPLPAAPPTEPPPPVNDSKPVIVINLPRGDTYGANDEVEFDIRVIDPDGVGSFTWGVFAQNLSPMGLGGEKGCGRATECDLSGDFEAKLPGIFFFGVDAVDTRGNTHREVKQIYIG